MKAAIPYDVARPQLTEEGRQRIEWADRSMPVLASIRERFERERPFEDQTIVACMHVTSETANLMRTLAAGGARVVLSASNPQSTQDDTAAALVTEYGISTFGYQGESLETYYRHIDAALDQRPTLIMDDGGDLVAYLHLNRPELCDDIRGGTEETTTGVLRLRAMEGARMLRIPMVAVNDTPTKRLFDNRYGTGQSTVDGIMRATNILLAGRTVVVAGYGHCGRGIASRLRGLGADVIVTEINAVRALEATMDGYRVMPMSEAAPHGDLFICATGNARVITADHYVLMKDGAIVCNAGHFDVEVDIPDLEKLAVFDRVVRPFTREFELDDGRRILLLADGRVVNLGAAEGHPASVMDMSFSGHALAAEWLLAHPGRPDCRVHDLPALLDEIVAQTKLASIGRRLDVLTDEQTRYLSSFDSGT